MDIPPPVFETFVSKQPSLPAKEEASPKSSEALSEEAPKSAETQSREGHNLVNRSVHTHCLLCRLYPWNVDGRLRNVKKRLTEIEELEKKRSSGQSLTPEQNKVSSAIQHVRNMLCFMSCRRLLARNKSKRRSLSLKKLSLSKKRHCKIDFNVFRFSQLLLSFQQT